jgi:hypothetical protein
MLPSITTQLTPSRPNSSVPQEDPKKKAQSILDSLPGSNLASKAAILSAGAGVSIAAISNEIYVVNEETIVMFALCTIFWAVAHYGGPAYADWAEGQNAKMKGILNSARENHTSAVKERIASVKELGGVIDITKTLFEVSKVRIRHRLKILRWNTDSTIGDCQTRGSGIRIGAEDCSRHRGQDRFGFVGSLRAERQAEAAA